MLIINADDYGRNRSATDNMLFCFKNGRITSASGMMFMADSERSAEMALEQKLDVGLHLNFTEKFSGSVKLRSLIEYQAKIAAFLRKNRYSFLVYNPKLKKCFDYVFKAQYEEYARLFNGVPSHVDGHQHMHLCTNMIFGRIIPRGTAVRRNFSFFPGEKGFLNRLYRYIVDSWLERRYIVTDFFFGFSQTGKAELLRRATDLALDSNVELMVHPERHEDFEYLMSEQYLQMISVANTGTYLNLHEAMRTCAEK